MDKRQALTSLRPASVKHHLSPHFTELKLADLVSEDLGNPFISTWGWALTMLVKMKMEKMR